MLRLVEMPGKAQRITKSEQGRGGIYIWAARTLANNVTGFILNVTLPLKVESWPGLGCDKWKAKSKSFRTSLAMGECLKLVFTEAFCQQLSRCFFAF